MSKTMTTTHDDFIMRPTVDVCFAGLMENPIVRKGFCAAVMQVSPDRIQDTELLPTHLCRNYANDKLGILDVRVRLMDGIQLNLEMQVRYFKSWDERALFYLCKMFAEQLRLGDDYENLKKCIHVSILDFIHFPKDTDCYRTIQLLDKKTNKLYSDKLELRILELKKLPQEVQTGDDLINWMRFFSGKSKEDFENMAKTSEYLGVAYEALQKLSADDRKRLEYEEREKALRDYNWIINGEKRAREEEKRALEQEKHTLEQEKRTLEQEKCTLKQEKSTLEQEKSTLEQEKSTLEQEKSTLKQEKQLAEERGEKHGEKRGIRLTKQVFRLHEQKKTEQEIADECQITVKKVKEILA